MEFIDKVLWSKCKGVHFASDRLGNYLYDFNSIESYRNQLPCNYIEMKRVINSSDLDGYELHLILSNCVLSKKEFTQLIDDYKNDISVLKAILDNHNLDNYCRDLIELLCGVIVEYGPNNKCVSYAEACKIFNYSDDELCDKFISGLELTLDEFKQASEDLSNDLERKLFRYINLSYDNFVSLFNKGDSFINECLLSNSFFLINCIKRYLKVT